MRQQKPTETASFYIWLDRALYLGTHSLPQRDYTVLSDLLIVCLEGSIRVKPEAIDSLTDPVHGKPGKEFRSVLLRAGSPIHMSQIDTDNAVIAVAYLKPASQDYQAVKNQMSLKFQENYYAHQNEAEVIQQLRNIRDCEQPEQEAYRVLDWIINPPSASLNAIIPTDPRINHVIKRIHATVRDNITIAELASKVHLSESGLFKLFKNEVGIPITKYRLKYRVFVGVVYMALGYSITDAALLAGFSNTAHFSRCFSAMTGLPPSNKYLRLPYIQFTIADEILQAVEQVTRETPGLEMATRENSPPHRAGQQSH